MSTNEEIHHLREHYAGQVLLESDLDPDPVAQFRKWFGEAREAALPEPNAMTLGTAGSDTHISLRTVLLKAYDEKGFVFFTNYGSRKARQMDENPRASLLFPWVALARQVEISGPVEKISAAESLAYFLSRPFGSRLGAWVSEQSSIISSREVLRAKYDELKERFASVFRLLANRYYLDELFLALVAYGDRLSRLAYWIDSEVVDRIFVDGWGLLVRCAARVGHLFDALFIDRMVDGTGGLSVSLGGALRRLVRQGLVQEYMLWTSAVLSALAFLIAWH